MDHGPGAEHRLLESGHTPTDVSHLFLSHMHYDHIMDYPRLVLQRWDMGAGKLGELEVFGPKPLLHISERLFGPDGAFGLDIESRVSHRASLDVYESRGGKLPRAKPAPKIREVTTGDVIEGKEWKVTVGTAQHFQPIMECLGYRLECEAGTVVYSGDSGGVPDSMVDLAKGCDVLIHMCHFATGMEPSEQYRRSSGSHMDVAEVAKRAGAKSVVLSHCIPMLDAPGVLEGLVREMQAVYDGDIIIGRDLMRVPIKVRHPGRID